MYEILKLKIFIQIILFYFVNILLLYLRLCKRHPNSIFELKGERGKRGLTQPGFESGLGN